MGCGLPRIWTSQRENDGEYSRSIEIALVGRIGPIRRIRPMRPRNFVMTTPAAAGKPAPDQFSFIPPHGNYRELLSYQKAEVVYDVTYRFCQRFLSKGDRTIDQMVQATRSGKQNIAEGS